MLRGLFNLTPGSNRCQSCGTMSHLEVHHREFRSHCGDDSELNLITLCTACHAQTHRESNFNPARGTKSLQTQSEMAGRLKFFYGGSSQRLDALGPQINGARGSCRHGDKIGLEERGQAANTQCKRRSHFWCSTQGWSTSSGERQSQCE